MNATARRLLQRNREANLSTVALMRRWEQMTQEIRPVPQPRPVKVRTIGGTARYLNGAPGTVPFPTVAAPSYVIPEPVETAQNKVEESPAMSRQNVQTAQPIATPAAAAAVSIVPTPAAAPAPVRAPRVRMADILEVMRDTNVQTAATLTALREAAAAAERRMDTMETLLNRVAGVVLPAPQNEARRSTGNVTGSQRTAAARAARAANVAARRSQTAPAAAPVAAAPVETARPARTASAAPVAAADVSYVQLLKGKNAAGNVQHSGQIGAAVYIVSWNAAAGVWDYSLTVGARTLVSGAVKGRNNAFAAVNSAAAKAGVRQVCAAS